MENERGITLVELLAALAIIGIVIAVIISVLSTGSSSADRTASKQRVQQEANYIVEVIRAEYLKQSDESITISIGDKKLMMDGKVISEGYTYVLDKGSTIFNLPRNINKEFELTVVGDVGEPFVISTTFSKLR